MTSSSSDNQTLKPFGRLLSLLALLAAALYYTGWIYRWEYYGFFQIEVTTLGLSFNSFYLAAFQALFGSPLSILRTIGGIVIAGFAIVIALRLRRKLAAWLTHTNLLQRYLSSSKTLQFLTALVDEFIIVLLILTILFWMARWQAGVDAWKDAVNKTSSLPVVTVVIPEEGAGLGRQLDNPLINPSGFRIIGDEGLYKQIRGQELTDTENPNEPRVWRLLRHQGGYFYIFPALPRQDRRLRIPVLIIYESSNQLVILSPTPSENNLGNP